MAAPEDPLLDPCSPATTTSDASAPGTPEVDSEPTISSPPSPTKSTEEPDLFSAEDPKKEGVFCAWTRFPQFDKNTILVRKISVAIGLMLVCEALSSVNMINSGFLAVHFTGRNITGAVYGLVGSGVGIGYMVSPFLNSFGRLYHDRGVPIHVILQGLMITYVVKCAAYAFSDYIAHDVIFSALSIAVRVFTGMLSYLWCMCLVEGVRCWLPDHFQLVNSLVFGTAGYIGYAIGSFVGTFCYELMGFHAPYLIIGLYVLLILIFSCMILPRDRNPISSFHRLQEEKSVSTTCSEDGLELFPCDALSPLVGLPLLGQTLVNIAGGYMVVVTVPFMMECCAVSATQASSIITAYSVVLAAGYFLAGMISQHQLLSSGTQAIIGGLLVTLGLLFMYPSPTLPLLYANSHYVGYLAIMLVGLGDPFVVSVTISSMESVQTDLCKRSLSAKQRSKISSLWLLGWLFGYYFGMFIAGVFLDTISFELGGWIVATLSLAGVGVFAATKLVEVYMKRRQPEKVVPEKVMPVI